MVAKSELSLNHGDMRNKYQVSSEQQKSSMNRSNLPCSTVTSMGRMEQLPRVESLQGHISGLAQAPSLPAHSLLWFVRKTHCAPVKSSKALQRSPFPSSGRLKQDWESLESSCHFLGIGRGCSLFPCHGPKAPFKPVTVLLPCVGPK